MQSHPASSTSLPAGMFLGDTADATYAGEGSAPGRLCPLRSRALGSSRYFTAAGTAQLETAGTHGENKFMKGVWQTPNECYSKAGSGAEPVLGTKVCG